MSDMSKRVETFWAAIESGNFAAASEMLTPDCEFTMPDIPPLNGANAVRGMFEVWLAALPDMRHATVHRIEAGDTYAAETSFTATHTGTLRTPAGDLPPTQRKLAWQSADIIRFRNGRIASWHVYHDPAALLGQLR